MNDNDRGLAEPAFPASATNADSLSGTSRLQFSICTIVTRPAQYAEMVQSFQVGGFTAEQGCEFLYLDNSSANQYEAYSGYNLFLRFARGNFIILCHQDVLLLEDGAVRLNELIHELNLKDPSWGLLGNSGGVRFGKHALRTTDKFGADRAIGAPFPVQCQSLDENFIVVRADANLALSGDLRGFHFYGTDICSIASRLGYRSYVVDFHLLHKGEGNQDKSFWAIRKQLIEKLSIDSRPQIIQTPCSEFVITPSTRLTSVANFLLRLYLDLKTTRLGKRITKLFAGHSDLE